jgi:hypothetical protein
VSSLLPFEGHYPSIRLSIAPQPLGGRVTGAGIDCGTGHSDCAVSPAVGAFALRAMLIRDLCSPVGRRIVRAPSRPRQRELGKGVFGGLRAL